MNLFHRTGNGGVIGSSEKGLECKGLSWSERLIYRQRKYRSRYGSRDTGPSVVRHALRSIHCDLFEFFDITNLTDLKKKNRTNVCERNES